MFSGSDTETRVGREPAGARRRLVGALSGILLGLSGALALPGPAAAQTAPGICDRTQLAQNEIVNTLAGVSRCQDVTATHLASITTLNLRSASLTSLQAGDFAGLSMYRTRFLGHTFALRGMA